MVRARDTSFDGRAVRITIVDTGHGMAGLDPGVDLRAVLHDKDLDGTGSVDLGGDCGASRRAAAVAELSECGGRDGINADASGVTQQYADKLNPL